MTAMASRGDLNLNLTPAPEYEEHLKEGLKYAMVQHEIVFKHQVFFLLSFMGVYIHIISVFFQQLGSFVIFALDFTGILFWLIVKLWTVMWIFDF